MATFHHRKLPPYHDDPTVATPPNILSGHTPPTDLGFQSDDLQIIYNFKNHNWVGEGESSHYHTESDECFIVLNGRLKVEVEGEIHFIEAREFCCFPKGVSHAIKQAYPPLEVLIIRAPSVQDKIYE